MSEKLSPEDLENQIQKLELRLSEYEKTIERLKNTEQTYKAIFEAANDAIVIHDLKDGSVLDVNQKMLEMYGYSYEEALQLDIESVSEGEAPYSQAEAAKFVKKAVSGQAQIFEWKAKHKNGNVFWVEVSLKLAVFDGQDRLLAIVRDITERKKAENDLKEKENKFRSLFENSGAGIAAATDEGRFLEINQTLSEMLGYTGEELSEMTVRDITYPDDRQRQSEAYRQVIQGNTDTIRIEKRFLHKSGHPVWCELTGRAIRDKAGKIQYVINVIVDITIRKQAERELSEREKVMRYIIKHDPNALAVYDDKLHYIAVSDRYLDDYNVEERDVLGKHHYEVFPEMPQRWKEVHQRVLQGSLERNDDDWFKRPDGSITYNRWECRPWYKFDGSIGGMITYTEVTTERKLAEKALRESEEKFRKLCDEAPISIMLFDKEGTIIFVNNWHIDVFTGSRLQKEFFLGKKVYELPGIVHAGIADTIKKVLKGDRFYLHEVHFPKFASGQEGYQRIVGVPIFKGANVDGGLLFREDLTQRKTAELERKKMESALQQAQKMESIGTLAGGIAHDFNNILSSVIGYTELSLDQIDYGTLLYENLSEVRSAGLRAKDLVKQILTLSRHEEHEKKTIFVYPLVKEALKMLRSTIPSSASITENITNEQLVVHADPTQIHQVIMNLATNAIHAMTDMEGKMEVSIQSVSVDQTYLDIAPGDYAKITVSDSGMGIPEDHLDKIFDPYFTTKEKGRGTGLGLAVVHGIVKSHKGYITVDSVSGKGTSFHVYLPLAKRQFVEPSEQTTEPLPTGTESILLVDDELPIIKMQQQRLERLGYKTEAIAGSIEALEVFQKAPRKFDLIITDMTMPQMTGEKLARAVKRIRPDIPVILCTGFNERVQGHEEALGVDAILMKPVDKRQMAETVRALIDAFKGQNP
jgi:PAS domain S-box-containing protein